MRRPSALTAALAAATLWLAVPGSPLAGEHRRGRHHAWCDHREHGHRHGGHGQVCRPPWPPPRAAGPHRGHDRWADAPLPPPALLSHRGGGRELLGSVLGGAVGGVVGSTIGKGSGRTAAVVGGTVLGVLVGGSIGRSMDDLDRLHLGRALETVPTRSSLAWQNPDTRAAYEVTPLATYQVADRYCREYTTTAWVAGQSQQVYGTACRQPDGSWEVVR